MAFAAALRTVFVDADLQARRCPPKLIRRAASIASSASPSLRSSEVKSAASQTATERFPVPGLYRSEETGQRLKVDLDSLVATAGDHLVHRDGRHVDDIVNGGPKRKRVHGMGQSHQDGSTAVAPPSSRSSL